jgi:hypothetical protein
MRRVAAVILSVALWSCGPAGPPIRYLVFDEAVAVPVPSGVPPRKLHREYRRVSMYRPAENARDLLEPMRVECGSPVLQNADLHLATLLCLTPGPCFGTHSAVAECVK